MINSDQREFIDTLARAIALESLDQTGKEDYYDLIEYVIHEASYEDIMLSVFSIKEIVKEQAGMYNGHFLDTDIERARRLSSIENSLSPLIGVGLALFLSGSVDRKITEPLAKKLGGIKLDGKTNAWGGFIKGAGGMLAWSGIALATKIAMKFLMVSLEKTKSVCRVICKKQFPPDSPHYKLNVNMCAAKCKLQGLNRTVSRLRAESAKCQTTPNPEKCQVNIVKIIGKYNDMISEEQGKVQSYAARLKEKISIEKQTGSTNPTQHFQGE